MFDVQIIDDVVDLETQDNIYNVIFSKDTLWTFSRTVFYDTHPEVIKSQKESLMSFTKPLIDDTNYSLYKKVLDKVIVNKILNARIQLQLPILTEKDKIYGVPHIDGHRPYHYKVAVYYVNDVDGDTVLFKQTTENSTPQDIKDGKLEIYKTISPKKGRLIIFDGNIYHSVGKPKTDLRCVLNFNFI
jgi:hypothetical protein